MSVIEKRKIQINKSIENILTGIENKKPKHFKTEEGFVRWGQNQNRKISDLEQELSMLNYPEEYAELPVAVVAEELGISISKVDELIAYREIEVSSSTEYSNQDFISRDELNRIFDLGIEELFRRANQTEEEIFSEAILMVSENDIERTKIAYERLEARESYSNRLAALEAAISIMEGNLEDALSRVRSLRKYRDPEDWIVFLIYLARLLKVIDQPEPLTQAFCEHILSIAEDSNMDPFDKVKYYKSKQIGKRLDPIQQKAMLLSTAIQESLKKYRFTQQFKRFHDRNSSMRDEEFEMIIRDTIYTTLHAEATYNESASSRVFIDTLTSHIPKWCAPADLLRL